MRPGQWLTRLSVYFDNRGVDGLVNSLAALIGGTSGRARRFQTGFVRTYALFHVRRRRRAGLRAPAGEALMNGFPWLTVAGAVPLLGAIVIMLVPGLPRDSAVGGRPGP